MDLTNDFSLQPHLLSMATAPGLQQQQQVPKLPAVPPLVPDAYVGMRLANSSSSSESLAAEDNFSLPSQPKFPLPGAYTFAPALHPHLAASSAEAAAIAEELTDIALDATTDQSAIAARTSTVDADYAAAYLDDGDDYGAYNNDGIADYTGAVANDEGGVSIGGGLLNPSVVADIANDIRDIKRAIAQQRKPLPSVMPTGASHGNGNGRTSMDSTEAGGVWVRMPSPQLTQQSQQPSLPQPSLASSLCEHSHPFYGNAAVSTAPSNLGPSQGQVNSQNGHSRLAYLPQSPPEFTAQQQQQQAQHSQSKYSSTSSSPVPKNAEYDSDGDTDGLMQKQYAATDRRVEIPELQADRQSFEERRKDRGREVAVRHPDQPTVLIEGLLFRALYLGSTQLISEGQPSKSTRMAQAQEAVGRIKAPDGEHQPCVPVDLFISTEKIMVLNTNLQEIMMDHALKTISYIADIGNVLVFMARRRFLQQNERRQTKIVCHVFETDEAQLVAQSIGQAFQVAYMDFLRANGIEDPGYQLRDMDYQDVLNQQDIIGEELSLFSRRETQKEVLVPKAKGEPLGIVIVESGWGSMLPTVVLANMQPSGPAARCGQLNIGDQLLAINGVSLVGLPLASCQQHVRACKSGTAAKVRLVSCPPVVEVLIRRPDVKFQLGFSVQNGVICSLLRGGIAERGGVRVGHRIIEINGQSVVATPHDRIVSMLASGVGEIHMKTMPTSIFRLLTGQEAPHYI